MIAVAWIGKEDVLIDIAGKSSANDRKNILVAIVVNIAKSHPVALLQMPKATRRVVTSWKELPSVLRNMRLGTSVAIYGSPVPM